MLPLLACSPEWFTGRTSISKHPSHAHFLTAVYLRLRTRRVLILRAYYVGSVSRCEGRAHGNAIFIWVYHFSPLCNHTPQSKQGIGDRRERNRSILHNCGAMKSDTQKTKSLVMRLIARPHDDVICLTYT
jgi:hypothetical protein